MNINNQSNHYDVVIIGAGAAGLFCAIEALKRGRRVIIIEQANKAGRKILMSGGGKCNFTNLHCQPEAFLSNNPHFCQSALKRYTQWDFIELVKRHHIPYHEKTLGQLFCDHSAKDIVQLLLTEAAKATILYQTSVQSIHHHADKKHAFTIQTEKQKLHGQSLVIASGGLTVPTMGSSPLAYQVAEQFDLKVQPTTAALVPLTLHPQDKEKLETLSGISVNCIAHNQRQAFEENMLFTHRGLSGPAILQLSSYWQPGECISLDFYPNASLKDWLIQAKKQYPQQKIKTLLQKLLPKRMIAALLPASILQINIAESRDQQLESIAKLLEHWTIQPNGTEGYRTAEVTLGGVCTDGLSQKTMAVKHLPRLYFIGEAVDVTGWLGGYNFQWAWSSGFSAGQVC